MADATFPLRNEQDRQRALLILQRVELGISTRQKPKAWFSAMFEVMEAFAAERGVKFTTADYWGIAA